MTDAPGVPRALGKVFGGTLHDWLNTGLVGILAFLYVANCQGWDLGGGPAGLIPWP